MTRRQDDVCVNQHARPDAHDVLLPGSLSTTIPMPFLEALTRSAEPFLASPRVSGDSHELILWPRSPTCRKSPSESPS